jgi:hypothetical protein
MEHQENPGDGEDNEEETGDPTEAKGIGDSKTMTLHLHREDMEEEIVIHHHGSFQLRIRYTGPEDGAPYRRL